MGILGKGIQRILVFGAGGGGDVVSAAIIALKLRKLGYEAFIAAAPWERFSIDQTPGPIRLEEVYNGKKIGRNAMAINQSSYALRRNRKILFQAVNVAKALNEEVYICELSRGVHGLYLGLLDLANHLDVDLILGVDVGGDILAYGDEEELWSPLADQISLAALYRLKRDLNINALIAIQSIGADGELSREEIISRLSEIAKRNGLIGALGFGSEDLEYIDRLIKVTVTEAGKILPLAIRGFSGWITIRRGSRRVYVDILSTIAFIVDVECLYELSKMAKLVADTNSIEEANEILVSNGIFTELELEKELFQVMSKGQDLSTISLLNLKRRIIDRIRGSE